MPSFLDTGIRYNPQNLKFRGHCDFCQAHQGFDLPFDVDGHPTGWTDWTHARNWIRNHVASKHPVDGGMTLEARMALGMPA